MARRKKRNVFKKFLVLILLLAMAGGAYYAFATYYFGEEENDIKEEEKTNDDLAEPEVKIVDLKSKSRPYAVMINNLGAARPYHTGLQDAYLVYEIIVEGGITRYMALFKDKTPEVVGSVRSARHYYLDYALENDAYYVHWGWSPQAEADISTLKVNNLNGLSYSTPYFFRQNFPISSEHTGFVNLKEMGALVEQKGYRTETNKNLLLKYSATPIDTEEIENRETANNVSLKYSYSFTTSYEYDSEREVYKQFVNGGAHVDYETKNQYTVKNIITYKLKNSEIVGGGKGRQELDNIGSGEGFLITNGVSMPITWEKKSRSAQTVYKHLDGTKIVVNDGNTWIHIVPTSGDISIS